MASLKEIGFDPFAGAAPAAAKPVFNRKAALAQTDKMLSLPEGFSAAQIQVESGGNPKARSPAGAMGLAQVMPKTLSTLSTRLGRKLDPDDEADAIEIHREVMRENLAKFKDPDKALKAYNGGWDPAKWNNPETSAYVGKVQAAMRGQQNPVMAAAGKVVNAVMPSAQAGQPPAQSATLKEVDFDPFAQAAPGAAQVVTAPPKRSMIQDLSRQLGLTVRAGVNGVAAIPAMAADAITGPINVGLDAVAGKGEGFRFKQAGRSLDDALTAAGLPKPENATERVVQDAASAVAGAGGMIKGGLGLANYAKGPVTQAVGKMLAAGPGLQLASAATGAGASGVTREAGGGQVAQIAAGLAGSLAPVGRAYIGQTSKGSKQLLQAATKANENGFVIPPADLNPGIGIEAVSGFSGKIKTAQTASQSNQTVTNQLVRKALGIDANTDLTEATLKNIRENAGRAYQSVSSTGAITPSASYSDAIDKAVEPFLNQAKSFPSRKIPALVEDIQALKTGSFDAADAIDTIKVLRSDADAAYRSGDKLAGKAYKNASQALEDAIDEHLVATSAPSQLLNGYRDARKTIAKTYTVGNALNSETGNVNAHKLSADLTKGRPLSAELKTIAEIGRAFPKAMQALNESPKQFSPLDFLIAAGASGAGTNPIMLAGVAARPVARYALLSKYAQSRALKTAGGSSSDVRGIPSSLVGATTRLNSTDQPVAELPREAQLREVDFDPFAQAAPGDPAVAQQAANPIDTARIEPNGMVPRIVGGPTVGLQNVGREPEVVAPDATQDGAEADPAQAFTSVQRPDGALAISGNPQALHAMLVATGIPARSIVRNAAGVMVGRSQAGRVQEAIARMGQPSPEDVATGAVPDEMVAENQPTPAVPENAQNAPVYAQNDQSVPQNQAPDAQTGELYAQAPELAGQPIDGNWTAFSPESGTLSVPRADMPQIKAEHRGAMVSFLKARGIDSQQGEVPAESLKPTQAEFSPEKVARAAAFEGGNRSILISSDGHVLDGHHQWLAKREAGEPVKVRQLGAPIAELLGAVREFPSAGSSEGAMPQDATRQVVAGGEMHEAAQVEPAAEPVHPMVARIQRLKDAGEDQVAKMLQRNYDQEQTLGAVQTELAGLLESAPDLPHHQNAHFQTAYQQQRTAGAKPAEAAARAGILAAVQETAPGAGMPAKAVAALQAKLDKMPVDDAPGFVQRFTQLLIAKGVMQEFQGADQIEQMLVRARDGSMNAMVESAYQVRAG